GKRCRRNRCRRIGKIIVGNASAGLRVIKLNRLKSAVYRLKGLREIALALEGGRNTNRTRGICREVLLTADADGYVLTSIDLRQWGKIRSGLQTDREGVLMAVRLGQGNEGGGPGR